LIVFALHINRMRVRYLIMGPSREDVLRRNEPTAVTLLFRRPHDFLPRLCGDQCGELGGFDPLIHSLVPTLLSGYYRLAVIICPIVKDHGSDLYGRKLLVLFRHIISSSLNFFKVGQLPFCHVIASILLAASVSFKHPDARFDRNE
jgi:hypothetical protein